ncbi:MAG: molecular chaperone TorD family protein [Candidatus Thiodiazotropha sp. (ex Epidulcina cf. delphinae)]|nr:molecular chaperone TorD family protein [Candidatus Thiodiazotropha sp. (ex Epidulcina cf. delphinae)]
MGADWKEQADSAETRSEIYGLLTTVFREEPTEALIKELRGSRLSGAFSTMELNLGDSFYNDPVFEVTEALVLEFTRLFIGPGRHISAHESVFVEVDSGAGGLWGMKTVEVKKFIESTGLDYEAQFTGLPDHVSVELEFMGKLAALEAGQWLQKDRKSADYCRSVQRMFLERHLLCWVFKFCDEVMQRTESPFYLAMVELTNNFMEFERECMVSNAAA